MSEKRFKSKSFKQVKKVTKTATVLHYRREKKGVPHCAICHAELNGIVPNAKGGKSRRTNSRIFGGNLCSKCTANIIMLGSRVERGEIKLDAIGMKERKYVLQLMAH